jgi:hypothetical protein
MLSHFRKGPAARWVHQGGGAFLLLALLILLAVPMPAFAANETVTMGTAVTNTQATKLCLDADTLRLNSTNTIDDGSTAVTYTTTNDVLCSNGCSTMLDDCRPSSFWELIFFLAVTFAIAVLLVAAMAFGAPGIILGIFVFLADLGLVIGDVFSSYYHLMLVVYAVAIAFSMAIRYNDLQISNKKAEEEGE